MNACGHSCFACTISEDDCRIASSLSAHVADAEALDLEEEEALRECEVRRSFMFLLRASRRSDGRS
jgi:hypothetical protein